MGPPSNVSTIWTQLSRTNVTESGGQGETGLFACTLYYVFLRDIQWHADGIYDCSCAV